MISYVNGNNSDGTANYTVTYTPAAIGNLLVLCVTLDGDTADAISAVTSTDATWSLFARYHGTLATLEVWWGVVAGVAADTITITTPATGEIEINVAEFSTSLPAGTWMAGDTANASGVGVVVGFPSFSIPTDGSDRLYVGFGLVPDFSVWGTEAPCADTVGVYFGPNFMSGAFEQNATSGYVPCVQQASSSDPWDALSGTFVFAAPGDLQAQLGQLSVQVGLGFTNATAPPTEQAWTDATGFALDFDTTQGREHTLDRIEAGTVDLRFDNRTGFFTNGTVNGTGDVMRQGTPVRIKLFWDGVWQPIFCGQMDDGEEVILDANQCEYQCKASDLLAIMATDKMSRPDYFAQAVTGAGISATNWYRLGKGSSTRCLKDQIGGRHGWVQGDAGWGQAGALLYDEDGCADLTNGSGGGKAAQGRGVLLWDIPSTGDFAVDFWVIGQDLSNTDLFPAELYDTSTMSVTDATLSTDLFGTPQMPGQEITGTGFTVADGFWHHVGIVCQQGNPIKIVIDNQHFDGLSITSTQYLRPKGSGQQNLWGIGKVNADFNWVPNVVGYVDEVVFSSPAGSNALNEVLHRTDYGLRMQPQQPSGQRIIDALTVCGYDDYFPDNFFIDRIAYSVLLANGQYAGSTQCQRLTQTQTDTYLLDFIYAVTTTEGGAFYVERDGTLQLVTKMGWYSQPWSINVQWDTRDSHAGGTYPYQGDKSTFVRDRLDLYPTVERSPLGGANQIVTADSSADKYGNVTLVQDSTQDVNDNAALYAAYWLLYLYQTPLRRPSAVLLSSNVTGPTPQAVGSAGGDMDVITGAVLNDRMKVVRTNPGDTSGEVSDGLIESIKLHWSSAEGEMTGEYTVDPFIVRNPAGAFRPGHTSLLGTNLLL